MRCNDIEAILDEHSTRRLNAAQRTEVDAHLGQCRRCADAWVSHELLANDLPGAPRPGFFDETLTRVLAEGSVPTPAARSRRFGPSLGLAAALAVVVLAASLAIRDSAAPPSLRGVEPVVAGDVTVDARDESPSSASTDRASTFVAGRHYQRLPVPAPTTSGAGKVEVCEFFMFACVHCFILEPALEAWRVRQPDFVELVRVPAIFGPTARLHAQAFYTAELLGRLDDVPAQFFDEIHVRGNPLADEAAIRAFFARVGIDPRRFDDVFGSPAVEAKVQWAEQLSRRYGVSATPSIGVNGFYLTSPSMAREALLDVVDTLVEAEAGRRCRNGAGSNCPVF